MRVVEAENVQTAAAGSAATRDMLGRIQQVTMGIDGDVPDPGRLADLLIPSEQEAAALGGQRFVRVRCDGAENRPRDPDAYSASTIMAMPIPPPMQSEARP